MSLQSIILESSRDVLTEMLAPEIADQLARRIVERAATRIDEALGDFFGTEIAREGTGKRRNGKNKMNGRAGADEGEEASKVAEITASARPEHDDAGDGGELAA